MSTHYTIGQFSEIVGVCVKTLQRWDREGRLKALRTHTNRRYYLDSHLSQVLGEKKRSLPRQVVVYCRVSSRQQATHLKNQREAMEHFCLSAGYRVDEWILEYGSGMNFKRKKFKNLISRILMGEIECLIVAHKDRLLRFGYDLLSHICQLSRCEIIIANSQSLSPQEELIDDLMAIIHTFSCRLYGLRSYKKKIKAIAKGDEGEVGAQDQVESKS